MAGKFVEELNLADEWGYHQLKIRQQRGESCHRPTIDRAARRIVALLKYFRPALPTKFVGGDKLGKGEFNLADGLSRPTN